MAPDEFKNLGFAEEDKKLEPVPDRRAGATNAPNQEMTRENLEQ